MANTEEDDRWGSFLDKYGHLPLSEEEFQRVRKVHKSITDLAAGVAKSDKLAEWILETCTQKTIEGTVTGFELTDTHLIYLNKDVPVGAWRMPMLIAMSLQNSFMFMAKIDPFEAGTKSGTFSTEYEGRVYNFRVDSARGKGYDDKFVLERIV
jgi:hypothetical protein